jgi:hypothetical protein
MAFDRGTPAGSMKTWSINPSITPTSSAAVSRGASSRAISPFRCPSRMSPASAFRRARRTGRRRRVSRTQISSRGGRTPPRRRTFRAPRRQGARSVPRQLPGRGRPPRRDALPHRKRRASRQEDRQRPPAQYPPRPSSSPGFSPGPAARHHAPRQALGAHGYARIPECEAMWRMSGLVDTPSRPPIAWRCASAQPARPCVSRLDRRDPDKPPRRLP